MATHGAGKRTYDEVATIPRYFIDYLRDKVHTGRGTGHQIATTDTIVAAVAAHPLLRTLVDAGDIAYFAGAKAGRAHRNIDLVFGPPGPGAVFDAALGMLRGMPTQVLAAGEYKTIMTEHGKNAGNRSGDFANHARDARALYGPKTLVFGACAVNAADDYYTYTASKWRSHGDGKGRAAYAVDVLRGCVSGSPDRNLDVFWTPVVVANNDPDPTGRVASWLAGPPQPPDGDELGWGHFVETFARLYRDRFS